MTSSLAGTVAHGARGGRGVSTSHFCRIFPGLSGTPQYSPELPGSGSHNTPNTCGNSLPNPHICVKIGIKSSSLRAGQLNLIFFQLVW